MKENKSVNHKKKILITLIVAGVFIYYIAVGVILSYMSGVPILAKIIALVIPAMFTGIAATLLVINIRDAARSRKAANSRQNDESGENDADNVR